MIYSCNIETTWINHVTSILHDLDTFGIMAGNRTASSLDPGSWGGTLWCHWSL